MLRAAIIMAGILAVLCATDVHGQNKDEDRTTAEANRWIYNDLPRGVKEAGDTGKPLLVVIRCPP